MSKIAVALVHFDTPIALLRKTLQHLMAAAKNCDNPIHVAIASNNDERTADLQALANEFTEPSISIVAGQGNVGFGRGNNLALKFLEASLKEVALNPTVTNKPVFDFVLLLNPDALLAPNALSIAINYLRNQNGCAMVAARGLREDGSEAYLTKREPSIFVLGLRGFAPRFLHDWFDGPHSALAKYERRATGDASLNNIAENIPLASGAAMLIRGNVWRDIRGFDERYFLYFEDFDISRRVAQHGRIDYVPDFCITHFGGNAGRKGRRHVVWFIQSAFRYFNTYGWRW